MGTWWYRKKLYVYAVTWISVTALIMYFIWSG